jgi:hypothetical protein
MCKQSLNELISALNVSAEWVLMSDHNWVDNFVCVKWNKNVQYFRAIAASMQPHTSSILV